jgi:hypothetical protein
VVEHLPSKHEDLSLQKKERKSDENILTLDCGNACTILDILKTTELYTKWINFMVYKLNFNRTIFLKKL